MLPSKVSFSGRNFGAAELELIRETVRDFSNLSLTELSKTICELLEWKRPTGKLKYEEGRAFLEHLRDQGVLTLPGLRATAAPGPDTLSAPPKATLNPRSPEAPAISIP